jgi:ribosomal protein S27E
MLLKNVKGGRKIQTHIQKQEGVHMNMICIACNRDVNLDHVIFENYDGPVKCFSCGAMMAIRTVGGVLDSVAPQGGSPVITGGAVLFPGKSGFTGSEAQTRRM